MRITIEVTPGSARRIAVIGVTLLILGAAIVSKAELPYPTFAADDVLTAKQLNDNFGDLDQRMTALESRVSGQGDYAVGATYCGNSPSQTTGSFSYDSKVGYEAAKAMCEASTDCGLTATAHMCTSAELVKSRALGTALPSGWYSNGVYSVDSVNISNDCYGWKQEASYGARWNSAADAPLVSQCGQSYPVLCCH